MNMKQAMKLYGWKMRESRRLQKLRQDEVGSMVGMTGATVSYYENAEGHDPQADGFQRLFKLFGGLGVFDADLNIIYKDTADTPLEKPIEQPAQERYQIVRINLDTGVTTVITHEELVCRAERAEAAYAAVWKKYQHIKESLSDLASALVETAELIRKTVDGQDQGGTK